MIDSLSSPEARIASACQFLQRRYDCDAIAVTARTASASRTVVAASGYPSSVMRFLCTDFVASDYGYREIIEQPGRVLNWDEVQGYRDGTAVQTVFGPAGFAQGTSLCLSRETNLGELHINLRAAQFPPALSEELATYRLALNRLVRFYRAALDLRLSDRKLDVLKLAAAGYSSKEIAARLHLSARTVDAHVASLIAAVGGGSRQAMVVRALQLGLVDLHSLEMRV